VSNKKTPFIVLIAFGLIVLGLRMLEEEPPKPPPTEPAADTGMSTAEREAFMRAIGYVQ
jgi:hypothetical protein